MKNKNYKQKRLDLKEEKREGLENSRFEDTQHRKKFVEGIKRSFRALKRSERQFIQRQINDEIE